MLQTETHELTHPRPTVVKTAWQCVYVGEDGLVSARVEASTSEFAARRFYYVLRDYGLTGDPGVDYRFSIISDTGGVAALYSVRTTLTSELKIERVFPPWPDQV